MYCVHITEHVLLSGSRYPHGGGLVDSVCLLHIGIIFAKLHLVYIGHHGVHMPTVATILSECVVRIHVCHFKPLV